MSVTLIIIGANKLIPTKSNNADSDTKPLRHMKYTILREFEKRMIEMIFCSLVNFYLHLLKYKPFGQF